MLEILLSGAYFGRATHVKISIFVTFYSGNPNLRKKFRHYRYIPEGTQEVATPCLIFQSVKGI